jgi:hypothetical protein
MGQVAWQAGASIQILQDQVNLQPGHFLLNLSANLIHHLTNGEPGHGFKPRKEAAYSFLFSKERSLCCMKLK